MTISGHVINGAIVPDEPVVLPNGAAVQIQVMESASAVATGIKAGKDKPTALEILGDVVGAIDDLPADGSRNLDHYLYETPKS